MGLFAKIFSRTSYPLQDIEAIVAVAAAESAGFGHNYIGTEHVLCALIQTSDTELIRINALFGLRIDYVRDSVRDVVGRGLDLESKKLRPRTPRLRRVLQLAIENGRSRKNFTLPRSLFLGILQDGNGVAIRALSMLSVNLTRLRQELEAANNSTDPTFSSRTPGAGHQPRHS
jgi:ATP-dependent Clp protease ATP-binding subunit ClpC